MLVPTLAICEKYTSITMVGLACSLLIIFAKIEFSEQRKVEKLIRTVSTATFGVYLIHDNSFVRSYFIKDQFAWIAELSSWKILPVICSIGAYIFLIAVVIEVIRVKVSTFIIQKK